MTIQIDRLPPAPEGLFKAHKELHTPTPLQLESTVEFHADHFWRRFLWRHRLLIAWILIAALVIIFAAWDALRAPPAHGAEQQIVEWDGVTAESFDRFMRAGGWEQIPGTTDAECAEHGGVWMHAYRHAVRGFTGGGCMNPRERIVPQAARLWCALIGGAVLDYGIGLRCLLTPDASAAPQASLFRRAADTPEILWQRTITAEAWDTDGGKAVKDTCTVARGMLREHWYVLEGPERKPETYILAVCVRLKPALQPEPPLLEM